MESQQHGDQLKRGLKNRHIQLIALGGAIGTGLFLGSASVIQSAGPGIILGYAIAGFIAFLIMRQLGEMVVEEPVAGSFSHFAYKYWGSFAGFASGWNYWVLYVLVAMAELTAVGKYIQFWYPEIPTWAAGQRQQPVEPGGLPAAWFHRSGDDDGDYHVLFRWTGAGWDHRSRSG